MIVRVEFSRLATCEGHADWAVVSCNSFLHFNNKEIRLNECLAKVLFCIFLQPNVFSMYLYDATSLYMTLADEIFREGGDFKDASKFLNRSKNLIFRG